MKPFDYEAAKRGDEVLTRDGREIKQLTFFDCDGEYTIRGVVDNKILSWLTNGNYVRNDESDFDLVMAPKETKFFLNIYKNEDGDVFAGEIHEDAKPYRHIHGFKIVKKLEFTLYEDDL